MTKVLITPLTHAVLKNYNSINNSLVVKKGNVVKTISNAENIIGSAELDVVFPQDFAIYDLGKFLNAIELFRDRDHEAVLVFDNPNYVTITSEPSRGRRIKYFFSDPAITMRVNPDREIKFPEHNINFTIDEDSLESLRKASRIFTLPDVTVNASQDAISLQARDRDDETTNVCDQVVRGSSDGEYQLDFKMDNLLVMGEYKEYNEDGELVVTSGDYDVEVSSRMISKWTHNSIPLEYFIALEP